MVKVPNVIYYDITNYDLINDSTRYTCMTTANLMIDLHRTIPLVFKSSY